MGWMALECKVMVAGGITAVVVKATRVVTITDEGEEDVEHHVNAGSVEHLIIYVRVAHIIAKSNQNTEWRPTVGAAASERVSLYDRDP